MNGEPHFHRTKWKVKLSSKWTNSIRVPLSVRPPFIKMSICPPAEGSRGSGNDNTTQHKGLQRLHSASLSLTKTFTRKWCKSRRRKKCCCSSLKSRLGGGKSRLGRLVFSSVHMNKQSQCGFQTWRMTHREIRGTICLILEQHRGSIWRSPIRIETKQVALGIFWGRKVKRNLYCISYAMPKNQQEK